MMDFEIDKDFALFYGILLGDGCLSLVNGRMKFIVITGSLNQDLPFFQNIISPILKRLRGKPTNFKVKEKYGAIEFNFVDVSLFDFIRSLGFPIGKKGDLLFIPPIFYEKNLLRYVVQGFFATDGSIVLTKNPNKLYPRLELHSVSRRVLTEVYDYLQTIGLNGGFYKCRRSFDFSRPNVQDKYRIQLNGKSNLILFDELIGFVNPSYEEKYQYFKKYDSDYVSSFNNA